MLTESSLNNLLDEYEESPVTKHCDYYSLENLNEINFKHSDLNILHFNIHSIIAKKSQLLDLINTLFETGYKLDVLLLCETFMNSNNIKLCNIPHFDLINYEYRKNSKQGGVAIYVRKGLKAIERRDLNI